MAWFFEITVQVGSTSHGARVISFCNSLSSASLRTIPSSSLIARTRSAAIWLYEAISATRALPNRSSRFSSEGASPPPVPRQPTADRLAERAGGGGQPQAGAAAVAGDGA